MFLSYVLLIIIQVTGADQENIEPGGRNSINYQAEPGAQIYFLSYI